MDCDHRPQLKSGPGQYGRMAAGVRGTEGVGVTKSVGPYGHTGRWNWLDECNCWLVEL